MAVKYSEIIYKNVSIAKATLNSAKAKYTSNIQMYKVNFLDNLEAENKRFNQSKRAPAADPYKAMAGGAFWLNTDTALRRAADINLRRQCF